MRKEHQRLVDQIEKDHALHAEIESMKTRLNKAAEYGKSYDHKKYEALRRVHSKKHYDELLSKNKRRHDMTKLFMAVLALIIILSAINLFVAFFA